MRIYSNWFSVGFSIHSLKQIQRNLCSSLFVLIIRFSVFLNLFIFTVKFANIYRCIRRSKFFSQIIFVYHQNVDQNGRFNKSVSLSILMNRHTFPIIGLGNVTSPSLFWLGLDQQISLTSPAHWPTSRLSFCSLSRQKWTQSKRW